MLKEQVINTFLNVTGAFADAVRLPFAPNPNLSGVKARVMIKTSMSVLLGKALGGMRVSAFFEPRELYHEREVIRTFDRLQIPLTCIVSHPGPGMLKDLVDTGAFLYVCPGHLFEPVLYWAQALGEKMLKPVIIVLGDMEKFIPGQFPVDGEKTARWLGESREGMRSDTSALSLVFGPNRRRMPKYLDPDQPVAVNAEKIPALEDLQWTARALYTRDEIQTSIRESVQAFHELTGYDIPMIETVGPVPAKRAVFCLDIRGPLHDDLLSYLRKNGITLHIIRQLNPLPALLSNGSWQAIQVLENVNATGTTWLTASVKNMLHIQPPVFQTGWYSGTVVSEELLPAAENLVSQALTGFYLNIPLTLEKSSFPKHQVLLQHIKHVKSDLYAKMLVKPKTDTAVAAPHVPELIREMSSAGNTYGMIGRFNDDTIIPIKTKRELIADPFQAFNLTPPVTSYFIDHSQHRQELPVCFPEDGTDPEKLVSSCSFSALPSTLFTIQQLVDVLMKVKLPSGEGIRYLMPLKGKLLKALRETALELRGTTLNRWLEKATSAWDLSSEEGTGLARELDAVKQQLGSLPMIFDEKWYHKPEKAKQGIGLVFSFAVNPYLCTGCGQCTKTGETGCLKMQPQESVFENLRQHFGSFLELPAPDADRLQDITDRCDDPFSALHFDKNHYYIFGGTPQTEIRESLSLIRYQLQLCSHAASDQRQQHLTHLRDLLSKLNDGVKSSLAENLPIRHFDTLSRILEDHREDRVAVQQLWEEWGQLENFKPLDKKKLERKLAFSQQLKQVLRYLTDGLTGKGRATCSIVLDESLSEILPYPYNPFLAPVIRTRSSETAGVIQGVAEAMQRDFLDEMRFLKKAELESKDEYIAVIHDPEIQQVTWENLTPAQKQLAPPVLAFAKSSWLYQENQRQLFELLRGTYPVRILMVDDGVLDPDHLLADLEAKSGSLWSLISHQKAMISNLSFADRKLLFRTMKEVMTFAGCSLMNVLVPDASAFEIEPTLWRELARFATATRGFLEWVYDPALADQSISTAIKTYIPSIHTDFLQVKISSEDEKRDYALSFADWAFAQANLRIHFTKTEKHDACLPMDLYLDLDPTERKKFSPYIIREENKRWVCYIPNELIVEASRLARQKFRILREWAGLYTKNPEKLTQEIKSALQKEFESAQQKREENLMAEKKAWEQNYLNDVRKKMKETLLNLSGM